MTAYNGWSSKAAWNVALWINNEYGLYKLGMDAVTNYRAIAPRMVQTICHDYFGCTRTPDGYNISKRSCSEWIKSLD